jgi:hypothetical protein
VTPTTWKFTGPVRIVIVTKPGAGVGRAVPMGAAVANASAAGIGAETPNGIKSRRSVTVLRKAQDDFENRMREGQWKSEWCGVHGKSGSHSLRTGIAAEDGSERDIELKTAIDPACRYMSKSQSVNRIAVNSSDLRKGSETVAG